MKLSNGFTISRIPLNYVLERVKVHTDPNKPNYGQNYTVFEGYSATLKGLYRLMLERAALEIEAETLEEFIKRVDDFMQDMKGINAEIAQHHMDENEKLKAQINDLQKKLKKGAKKK